MKRLDIEDDMYHLRGIIVTSLIIILLALIALMLNWQHYFDISVKYMKNLKGIKYNL